jgi:hypothetical protein
MLKKTLLVTAMLFVAVIAFAQTGDVSTPAPFDPQAFVAVLFAAGLPFLTSWVRSFAPGLPRMVVWTIPPVLGALLGYLGTLVTGAAPGGWKGFLLGLIAIAVREAKSTFDEHGINGA